MFSPRFKSVAEMAGWDEETLLLASLVVEDTPDRIDKKRSLKSPTTSSTARRRKRRGRQRSPCSMGIPVFNLDDDNNHDEYTRNKRKGDGGKAKSQSSLNEIGKDELRDEAASCSTSSTLPCMDRLREELSCAICLEICFEPSTTPCGHSFCKKCLRSAADKCGKRCPKCRQLISNGRSCTINTVLWNTIQLLFPGEVEARKAARVLNNRETESQSRSERGIETDSNANLTRRIRPVGSRRQTVVSRGRRDDISLSRREVPVQDEDAALALRLQREEFMAIYRGSSVARDNLRAMAQRAINTRVRHRAV